MNEPSPQASRAVGTNIPAQWMNNSFAASANNNNNMNMQPQQHRKPKRNRNNSDNQKIVSGRSFKRLRLDHTANANMGNNSANMMSSTQSTDSVSHLSMGGAGKSAFVLFYHMISCVQYKYLTLVCLYLIALQTSCTNRSYYHLSSCSQTIKRASFRLGIER